MVKLDIWQTDDALALLRGWARDGYGLTEIAAKMGLSVKQLNTLMSRRPDIFRAVSCSREKADYSVEDALLRRAVGFSVTEEKAYKLKRVDYDAVSGKKTCEREEVRMIGEQTYFPPDLKAIEMWLCNRLPDKWNQTVDKSGGEDRGGVVILPEVKTDD